MEEKERYYYKKILRDCVIPEGLFEIKDRKCNKWFLIIEDKKNADKIIKKLNQQDKENKQLKQQLSITEKALELACETLQDINFKLFNTEMNFVDYFKARAKEMLGNE